MEIQKINRFGIDMTFLLYAKYRIQVIHEVETINNILKSKLKA